MGLSYIFFAAIGAVITIFALAALGRLARLIFAIAGDIAWKRRKPQLRVDNSAGDFHKAAKSARLARSQRHD